MAGTIGPDGNLWFAGQSSAGSPEDVIGRVSPSGQVTEFPLHGDTGVAGIVAGPDGNLWFTERAASRIGRITLSGEITEFPLPSQDRQPDGITAGADGNVWFTEEGSSQVGRITPAGTIAEFQVRPNSRPTGIVAGSDGNLWFTERAANRIGRITLGGEITEFVLPGKDRKPSAIVVGPDGNLWFAEEGAAKVGRITPAGAIAEFPVPTLTGTSAIAAGPDGNLWFTSGFSVGSVSPSGQALRLACLKPTCHLPAVSLTTGRDGELWAGTTTEYPPYGGGGGAITLMGQQPGYLAKLIPQPPTLEIGPNARFVKNRTTSLRISCADPAGCGGILRLIRVRPSFPGHAGSNSNTIVLAHRGYELAAGESRRLRLRLSRKGAELLAARHSLSVWTTAGGASEESLRLLLLRGSASH